MFTSLSKYTFSIMLPSSTTKDVMEWFEIMESNNKLADALVELVHESIKSGRTIKAVGYFVDNQAEVQPSQVRHEAGYPGSIFENLYNWQDSNNAVFEEEKEGKKEKKRMLSV